MEKTKVFKYSKKNDGLKVLDLFNKCHIAETPFGYCSMPEDNYKCSSINLNQCINCSSLLPDR